MTSLTKPAFENSTAIVTDLVMGVDGPESSITSDDYVESYEMTIEDILDDINALESYSDVISKSSNLNDTSVKILSIGLESIFNHLGVRKEKVLPALEAYSESTKKESLQLAIEGIKDTIKNIYEAIIFAINNCIDWFKNFYNRIFNNAKIIKNDAKKFREELDQKKKSGNISQEWLDNTRESVTEFHDDVVFKHLNRNSDCKDIRQGAEELLELTRITLEPNLHLIDEFVNSFEVGNVDRIKELINEVVGGFGNKKLNVMLREVNNPHVEGFHVDPMVDVFRSNELFGNKALIKHIGNLDKTQHITTRAVEEKLSKYKFTIGVFKPSNRNIQSKKIDVVSVSEMYAISRLVEDIMSEVEMFQDSMKRIEAAEVRLSNVARTALRKNIDDINADVMKHFSKVAPVLAKLLNQPYASFNKYLESTCHALMIYVRKCNKLIM